MKTPSRTKPQVPRFGFTWANDSGPTYLVKQLEELGTGLVDGADDGPATLGQPLHQGDNLEAGGAVQAAVSQGTP